MTMSDHRRFARQFVLTRGRARSVGEDLSLDALVVASPHGAAGPLSTTDVDVLRIAHRPIAIAEVAARMGVHLGIARVLVSDLAARRLVQVSPGGGDDGPDLETLERLLDALQQL